MSFIEQLVEEAWALGTRLGKNQSQIYSRLFASRTGFVITTRQQKATLFA